LRVLCIGLGNMGLKHALYVAESPSMSLVGICDTNQSMIDRALVSLSPLTNNQPISGFTDYLQAMDQVKPDGIIIATIHYSHPEIALAAFDRGIHVLVEKPLAVHAKDARTMVQGWLKAKEIYPGLIFSAMFQQRTHNHWKKIKELISQGSLGRLVRTTWIITDWYRTQHYYNSGGWRATWAGEGGGVLLNQCPHNLDLYCWFVGLPKRVTGFASLGKYHDIEVEDEVTGYFEHENAMVGHFITTTAEAPGTNRLEIVGEHGKLLFEHDKLTFYRNDQSMIQYSNESDKMFEMPGHQVEEFTLEPIVGGGHDLIIQDFADAFHNSRDPIVPAQEGVESVLLGNAILFSALEGRTIEFPMDELAYANKIKELAKNSRYQG
jgi:predicted dehydrogenase